MHNELQAEREQMQSLQSEHNKLLRQQEVLAAELALALDNYKPKATIDSGTPADKMLAMMTDLLDGSIPSIQDILFVQVGAVLQNREQRMRMLPPDTQRLYLLYVYKWCRQSEQCMGKLHMLVCHVATLPHASAIPLWFGVFFLQAALLESHDVYRPMDLGKQLLQSNALDVSRSFLRDCGPVPTLCRCTHQKIAHVDKYASHHAEQIDNASCIVHASMWC